MEKARSFTPLEKGLIDGFQRDFPLVPRPYAAIADRLDADEDTVLETLSGLLGDGVLSRLGAVVAPHKAGWSTLAAVAAPPERLEDVAAVINAFPGVNHNYEREHRYNIWFVVTGPDREAVTGTLDAIGARVGLPVLDLPLEESFYIDLGFKVLWS